MKVTNEVLKRSVQPSRMARRVRIGSSSVCGRSTWSHGKQRRSRPDVIMSVVYFGKGGREDREAQNFSEIKRHTFRLGSFPHEYNRAYSSPAIE